MVSFLEKIYHDNLELINYYKDNFIKKLSSDSDKLSIEYFLNEICICTCSWTIKGKFSISTSSISTTYLSLNDLSVCVLAAIIEELNFCDLVYFLKSKNKIKKMVNKFCSSELICIELDGKLMVDVVGVRGNLEENDFYKFPLVCFS